MPFADAMFDLVISIEVMEHVRDSIVCSGSLASPQEWGNIRVHHAVRQPTLL